MQTIFCTECGAKNIYSGAKPKFCSSCGTPTNVGDTPKESKSNQGRPATPTSRKLRPIKEDETDIDYVPEIRSLAYEIEDDGVMGSKVHKIKDLVNVKRAQEETEEK